MAVGERRVPGWFYLLLLLEAAGEHVGLETL